MATSDGLSTLYDQHRPDLLRFLIARTGDRAEAEDVVQELWLRAQSAPAGPVGNGRAYLFRMAQNLVLDRLRERQRRAARDRDWSETTHGGAPAGEEVADARDTAEDALLAREEAERLAAAIQALPDGARRAFRLHKIDGLSHGEVAQRLGISRSGVEKHMALALKHLRAALRD
jgi:RNA polymerase sigma-70 factor (ECF subfamily)